MLLGMSRAVLRVAVGVAQTLCSARQAGTNIIARSRSVIVIIYSRNRSVVVVMNARSLSVIVVLHSGDRCTGAESDRQCKSRESKSLQSLHHVSPPLLLGVDLRGTFQSPCRRGRYADGFSDGPSERRTFNPSRAYT
jgi:hypothetical protein